MGNLALCMRGGSISNPKNKKMLQVFKMNDGKLLEFTKSNKVKDLLVNYPNSYVGLFKDATQGLPLEYKLKIGKVYYLFPSCWNNNNIAYNASDNIPQPQNGAIRVKLVISRHELNKLLSSRVRVDPMIMEIDLSQSCLHNKLDCIPE